jgi:hypothetical protein
MEDLAKLADTVDLGADTTRTLDRILDIGNEAARQLDVALLRPNA